MHHIDKEIGLRLKIARKAANHKTALAFANSAGIPKSTYSQHENGKRSLTADQIMHYSNLLSIEPSWLLTGLGHPCPLSNDKTMRKEFIDKEISLLQSLEELPINKNIQISADDNSAVVNMVLFSKILIAAIKELVVNNLHIEAEELVKFCIEMYNNIEFLNADDNEKNTIINFSIKSMLIGNKIALHKKSNAS